MTRPRNQAPPPCATRKSCGVCQARRLSCHGLTHSLLTEVSTGVLWVLTGTHPCGTSTQAGWWRYQSASSDVRQCWCWFLLYTWSCLVVVLPCRTVCHRRSSSNDIACVVVRSRDSSYSVKSADSSTLTLCERGWALVITTFHSSQ